MKASTKFKSAGAATRSSATKAEKLETASTAVGILITVLGAAKAIVDHLIKKG